MQYIVSPNGDNIVSVPTGFIILQPVSHTTSQIIKVKEILVKKRTKYQEVIIANLEEYGISLILDNLIQSTQIDEYIYHEALVHIAMFTHPNPEKVLIIGGGEGATLREVLKHGCVKSAIMVDIDGELVELAKKYLEVMHKGAFNDPRAKIIIMDGKDFVNKTKEKYDIIILDLTDPYGPEISKDLYSKAFYTKVYEILEDDGIMVTQAGSSFYYEEVYDNILKAINEVFPIVCEYNVWIPSFGYACNFILGSKRYNPKDITLSQIKQRIIERGVKTKFYNEVVHHAVLSLPIYRPK